MNFSQLGFGFFVLKTYGIFLALIFCISAFHYYRKLAEEKLDLDYFVHHLWRWVVAGIIGGRIVSLLLYPEIFSNNGLLSPLAFWDGGISFYGAMICFLIAMFYDLKFTEHKPIKWLDLAMPSILIGLTLSDLAAFFTGAVYGTVTNLPWGVQYETFGVATISPVHPVTIYAFIIHLALLNWVLKYGKNFLRQRGKLTIITAIMFFFAEFFLQFFRGDHTFEIMNTLRIEQVFAFIIVAFLGIYLHKHKF